MNMKLVRVLLAIGKHRVIEAMDGDALKAKEAGCDDYITKPIDTKLFLKTIEKYLAA